MALRVDPKPYLCISGVEEFGVHCASLSYVKHEPARYNEQKAAASEDWSTTREEWERGSIGRVAVVRLLVEIFDVKLNVISNLPTGNGVH